MIWTEIVFICFRVFVWKLFNCKKWKKNAENGFLFGQKKGVFETCNFFLVRIQLECMKIKKSRGNLTRGPLLRLQDNARVYTAYLSVTTATNCSFELLLHPPYSHKLTPSDYHLFPNMKKVLRGKNSSPQTK